MRGASERWARQSWKREMRGDVHPVALNPVIRLPDPEDYAEGSLERMMALRLREISDPAQRELGRVKLDHLTAAYDDCAEYMEEVGMPAADQPGLWDDWDDEDDWKEARW